MKGQTSDRWTLDRGAAGVLLAIGAVAAIGIATLLADALWEPHIHDPSLRGGIEMMSAILLLLSTWLLRSSYRATRTATAYLGFVTVLAVTLVDLLHSVLPTFLHPRAAAITSGARTASSLVLLTGFAIAVAVSALSPTLPVSQRRARTLAAAPIFGALAAGLVIDRLGTRADSMTSRAGVTSIALMAAVLLVMVVLVLAWSTRPTVIGPPMRWLNAADDRGLRGPTIVAVAAALFQLLLLPAAPAGRVTPAEGMRLLACGLLLLLAVRVSRATQRRFMSRMMAAERVRIARDFHDGLAQDLSFIAAHGERLADQLGAEHPVAVAARRALDASRGVIVDLAASGEGTTLDALRAVADEIQARYDVEIEVEPLNERAGLPAGLDLEDRHEVVRIAREAIVNAVTHGGARSVRVGLGTNVPGQVLLRVFDDGVGFDESASVAGLGLRTMRQRARQLDAGLSARRGRRGGTEIEVRS